VNPARFCGEKPARPIPPDSSRLSFFLSCTPLDLAARGEGEGCLVNAPLVSVSRAAEFNLPASPASPAANTFSAIPSERM